MVRLRVKNWRCVEDVEVSLEPITIFIGRNATGKSSLAYAPYFLTRVVEWRDANKVLAYLYGVQLDGVVRTSGSEKHYPVVIDADGSRFEAKSASDISMPNSSPWSTGYLLPSQRLSFIKVAQFIPKLGREIIKRYPEAKALISFANFIYELLKGVPVLPPMFFFVEDLMKLYLSKGYSEQYELGDTGTLIEEVTLFGSMVVFEYVDPLTKLNLPIDLAPDGFVDLAVVKLIVEKARENSLLVVEEPEIHKNPIQIVDLVKYLAKRVVERRLTLVMTTHNDIAVQALAKAVEEKMVKPSQVAIYYLERSSKNPWTNARRIEVYEDGTVEELPDSEKVVSMLF